MVAVIILNFKLKEATLQCIKSVQQSSFPDLKIVVVDNNSGDDLEEALPKDKNLTFIQTEANLGYTGGNNIGIRKALDLGADYVWILNPDMEVSKTAISNLVQACSEPKVGIVGPKIFFSDRKTIWYAGGIFDMANIIGSHKGVDQPDSAKFNQDEETDFVTGGAMMVKSEVFQQIGLLDERYFLYYEDSDFSFRAKKAGFKLMYSPEAVVYHANGSATGVGSALQDYFITRNRLLFGFKFAPLRTKLALLREAVRNIMVPTRRLALWDFCLGNFGKGSYIK